jgi:SAM-dependent methyltransferase
LNVRFDGRSIIFPNPGEYYFYSVHGSFKFLIVPPDVADRDLIVQVARFVSGNCVHSLADYWMTMPRIEADSACPFDAEPLGVKFFTSDQPLQLVCGEIVSFLALLLHRLGVAVRKVHLFREHSDVGLVVLEARDPATDRWLMMDPDYGVYVTDRAGRILSTAEFLALRRQPDQIEVVKLVDKHWPLAGFYMPSGFFGQKTWQPACDGNFAPGEAMFYLETWEKLDRNVYYGYRFTPDDWCIRFEKIEAMPSLPVEKTHPSTLTVVSDLCRRHADKFNLAGDVHLDKCPVCFGTEHPTIWQLPMSYLDKPTYLSSPGEAYDQTHINYLPMLTTPHTIFVFDMCQDCGAIFLNPKRDAQAGYANDVSKIEAIRDRPIETWRGAAANFMKHAPPDTRVVVDAACGAGEVLANVQLLDPGIKPIALELSRPSIEFIHDHFGIEGHVVDLDLDELDAVIAPGSVDYVIFCEAYEHVRTPTVVLQKLLRLLRPGGRISFSAQAYGPQFNLHIRPGEPIFICDQTLQWMIAKTNTRLVQYECFEKMHVTLEKT